MPLPEVSVSALMPVHAGVDGGHLEAALNSLLGQTRVPDEIVIVEDGPLPIGHLDLVGRLEGSHRQVVRVRLEQNQGAGVANQAGLETASGEWIAKADADDVSLPDRIEAQLEAVCRAGADLCGSAMMEFREREDNVISVRSMPSSHEGIGVRLRWNNPVNHPTAFYRRTAALDAGGYPAWRNMQDYGLMARMYANGARMMNLDEALVLFRSSPGVTARRRSALVRRLEWQLQRELRDLGIIGTPQMVSNVLWRSAFRLMPRRVVSYVSRRLLARVPVSLAATADTDGGQS